MSASFGSVPAHAPQVAGSDRPLVVASAALAMFTVVSWSLVGAWPMALILASPVVVASHLAHRRSRAAAIIAGLLGLVMSVVWFVTSQDQGWMSGWTSEDWYLGAPILMLGPVAVLTVVIAVRALFRRP